MIETYTVTKLKHKRQQQYEVAIRFPNGEIHHEPVHEELVLKFRLVEGKELTEEQMAEFMGKRAYGEAYQAAMRLVAAKLYPMSDVSQKLLQKGFEEEIVDEVLFKLVELGLLNDEKYAISYINHHMAMGKKGPSLLKRELQKKGISERIIDRYLSNFGEEEALGHALKLAKSLVAKNKRYGSHFLKQKVAQHLQQKGFSSSISRQAVETALKDVEADEEEDILYAQARKLFRKYGVEGQQKLLQSLGRKGFSYHEAKKAFEAIKEEMAEIDE